MSNDMPEGVEVDKGGRPTIYSEELADDICLRIANGSSLNRVCRSKDMPSKSNVYEWLAKYDGFQDKYREATNQRAEFHFDEMLDIADAVKEETAAVSKAKVQIDTRKWILSRMNPTKYGDKQQVDNISSDGSSKITVNNFNGDAQAASQAYQDIMGGK